MRCEENIVAPVRSETFDFNQLDRLSHLLSRQRCCAVCRVTQLYSPYHVASIAVPARKGNFTLSSDEAFAMFVVIVVQVSQHRYCYSGFDAFDLL